MNDKWGLFNLQSRLQVSSSTPISGVSGVPQGVGPEEGQLAAVLDNAADLVHLHPMAQLGQHNPVPCINYSISSVSRCHLFQCTLLHNLSPLW